MDTAFLYRRRNTGALLATADGLWRAMRAHAVVGQERSGRAHVQGARYLIRAPLPSKARSHHLNRVRLTETDDAVIDRV